MRIVGGQRGQSLIEYAILVGVVVTALTTAQTYVRRSLQGRLHDAAMLHCDDPIGSQFPCNSPPQYEPYYASSSGIFSVKTTGNYSIAPDSVSGGAEIVTGSQCLDEVNHTGCPRQTVGAPP